MTRIVFKCTGCGREYTIPMLRCSKCNSLLEVVTDKKWSPRRNIYNIWRYETMLPKLNYKFSLGEGWTPVIESKWYSRLLGLRILFKDESRNPTGSVFDRSSAIISSYILSTKTRHRTVVVASDGNMGASLLAYLANTGIEVKVIVPRTVDEGKKAQMKLYGGHIIEYGDVLDEAVDYAVKLSLEKHYYNATVEYNPLARIALRTIAYELYEQAGKPNTIVLPAASGTTAYAVYKGFQDLVELGLIDNTPRIIVVQTPPYPSIASLIESVSLPYTSTQSIPGLTYRQPPLGSEVARIVKKTSGEAIVVSVEEVYESAIQLARKEGLLVEPASAAVIAGLHKAKKLEEPVVALLTGSGLKMLASYIERRRGKSIYHVPTKTMILRIIGEEEEIHGYAIWRKLSGRITPQTVYQHLSELKEMGLVEVEVKNRRKVYRLTSKGKQLLEVLSSLET